VELVPAGSDQVRINVQQVGDDPDAAPENITDGRGVIKSGPDLITPGTT